MQYIRIAKYIVYSIIFLTVFYLGFQTKSKVCELSGTYRNTPILGRFFALLCSHKRDENETTIPGSGGGGSW